MRVLLVEDELALANALTEHLELSGMAVDGFDHLRQAETALLTTEYDIVLLDLQLVDGDAIPWLKKRRQAGLTTPVIILTARDQISDRIAGLDAGADDYVIKPYDLDEVNARIPSRDTPWSRFSDQCGLSWSNQSRSSKTLTTSR